MKTPPSILFAACILPMALALSANGLNFTEDFEGWTGDTGTYLGVATYTSTNGMWASNNSITSDGWVSPDVLPSIMVRFQRFTGADTPWLEYRGLDGNGIDGGVGTVTFDYRHWDGDSNTIAFQLQYSINGGAWTDTGPEVTVPNDTNLHPYSHALNLPDDNIKLRVLSTVSDERLLLDDFAVTDASTEPLIRFEPTSATVDEPDGTHQLTVTIAPASAATVEVAQIGGDAMEGSDFTISPTTLVFSAGIDTAFVTVTLNDDMAPENTESAVWALVNPVGGVIDAGASIYTLTITDDDSVTVAFATASSSAGEATGAIEIPVVLSRAADAYVELQLTGTAEPITDYTLSTTSLVFTATGPTSQTVTVTIQEDGATEPAETLVLTLAASVGAGTGIPTSHTLTILDNDVGDDTITVLAANLTSGNFQSYPSPGPGSRIMQALQPDIVGIQEFNTDDPGGLRGFVDNTFGTNFHYMVEGGGEQIPNGIISRWPIIASGEWNDSQVSNRDFAWATIDIPGDTNLHVVSVHLLTSGSTVRNQEAQAIIAQVQANFPPNDYIVLAGDFNTGSRSESAVNTLKAVFFDTHQPEDQFGDDDTNAGRSKPYDWVMPNASLNNLHTSLTVGGIAFPDGIVMDTRIWGGSPPSPALAGDSGASSMQHMGVMKAFAIPSTSVPLYAAMGTPYAWLIANGFTNNFDAAELLDTDMDGMFAWQEYIAGTIPTNGASYFLVTQLDLGTTVDITIDTQPGRRYTVEYSDSYASSPTTLQWDEFISPAVGVYDETSPAPGTHTFIDDFGPTTTAAPPPDAIRTYRVHVILP